jgi:spermidine synthase
MHLSASASRPVGRNGTRTEEVTAAHPRLAVRSVALAAAALGGLAGLALEILWLAALGPALGHGRAAPIGLGAWVAGWALGAAAAGAAARRGHAPGHLALAGGLLSAVASATVLTALVHGPATVPQLVAVVGMLATALGQGAALPLLAAAFGVRTVWAVNLAGSVAGARLAAWELPAALGRDGAAWVAAALAACAGGLAWVALRGPSVEHPVRRAAARRADPRPEEPGGVRAPVPDLHRPRLGLALALLMGAGTAWLVVVQGVGVRLAGVWLGGHQDATALVLVASLGALALGAAVIGALAPRGPAGVLLVVGLGAAGSVLVGLGPGAWAGRLGVDVIALERASPLGLACLLVAPALVPLGALVPALARSSGDGARRYGAGELGALLLHEAWGGFAAALLFPFVLVPRLGLAGALGAALAVVGLALAAFMLRRAPTGTNGTTSSNVTARTPPLLGALLVTLLVTFGGAWQLGRAPSPALASPALDNPAFTLLSFAEDADYAVTVVADGMRGELTLLTDDFRATATGPDYTYMRALGHVPLLLHPAPKRVAVLALGTGTTVGAVARHPSVERIDVLELSRAVVAACEHFKDVNNHALANWVPGLQGEGREFARVVVHLGDGRRLLRELADEEGPVFDVLTMEPLLPDAPFAVHLYTEGFYREAQRALAPGGIVCQWVPPHALAPEVFIAVCESFRRAHPWSAAFLHGTQLLLVGAAAEPTLDAARHDRSKLMPGMWKNPKYDLESYALGSPASLAALLVASPAAFATESQANEHGGAPSSAYSSSVETRRLTDADPWIVYRPRPAPVDAVGFLATNLARLRASVTELPPAWADVVGEVGHQRREVALGVLACREAWSAQRATAFRAVVAVPHDLAEVDRRRRALKGHPEEDFAPLRWLDEEVRFEHGTSVGLGAVVARDFERALSLLTLAAEVRPFRADAHLHVALAATRAGQGALAARALARALELCPRALETRAGRRALELGLSAALAGGRDPSNPAEPVPK